MQLNSMDDVLELAIAEEERAAETYRTLADATTDRETRTLLLSFAAEEESHRESLERAGLGDLELFANPGPEQQSVLCAPPGLEIGPDADPKTVILAAMDAERRAFLLYKSLADRTEDAGIRTLLDAIAREETQHWNALETIYDSMCGLGGGH